MLRILRARALCALVCIGSGNALAAAGQCAADLDGDGDVDLADLGQLLQAFGVDAGGDTDGDGDTDLADLGQLLQEFEACSSTTEADRVNIDFSDETGVPSNAYGAAAGQAGHWNVVTSTGTTSLRDVNGVVIAAVLQSSSGSQISSPNNFNGSTTPSGSEDERLMDDLFDLGGIGTMRSFRIENLQAGQYTVFVYAGAPDSFTFVTLVTVDGVETAVGGFWPDPFEFKEGVTHAVFGPLSVGAGGTIQIDIETNVGFGSLNGIQVVGS
jgi:hypothetical protein